MTITRSAAAQVERYIILKVRADSHYRSLRGQEWRPIKPTRIYRIAMAITKSPYDFKKVKRRRKIAKESRRRNRR